MRRDFNVDKTAEYIENFEEVSKRLQAILIMEVMIHPMHVPGKLVQNAAATRVMRTTMNVTPICWNPLANRMT